MINNLSKEVLAGNQFEKEEIINFYNNSSVEELLAGAKKIKDKYLSKHFEFCSIINAKSGHCSEDCKFCAQSVHYNTSVETYELLDYQAIFNRAKRNQEAGIEYFSLVTTGGRLSNGDFATALKYIKRLKQELSIKICASFGMLSKNELEQLKKAGLDRYHHNLETSQKNYKNICSTHSYSERVQTIKNAISVGLSVCSGGIIGLGETIEDLIDMAYELRQLKIQSIPINILVPVENTPYEHQPLMETDEMVKKIAILRYIFPKQIIRLAGGRLNLQDQVSVLIENVVNASITGDLLTTTGSSIKQDFDLIKKAGY